MEKTVLVAGPVDSAVGGVASIMRSLVGMELLSANIVFFDTAKPSTRAKQIVRPVKIVGSLIRALVRQKVDILVVFSSAGASFWEKCLWMYLARQLRVASMVMMVDGNFPSFYARLPDSLKGFTRFSLSKFDTVIVQSKYWLDFYRKVSPSAHLCELRFGVDCQLFRPGQWYDKKQTTILTILYVGWFIEAKGVFDLLEAAMLLKERGIQFRLRLVGPYQGNERRLKVLIRQARLQEHVSILGALDSDQALHAEYRRADLFVLPSHAEGFPVALLEAMASGLAVVASAVGGIPDILNDDRYGLLVRSHDPVQLASTIESLIKDLDLQKRMRNFARKRVVSSFTLEQFKCSFRQLVESRISSP